ncbi:ATP-binding protein [Cohnella sp. WQ 127256]|uniref:ATP-binding protein n=1 Tax=Cohnella sp. WQ 127256 TaxID=2938790 RepID=UPI002117A387|nr:ATP-binding protein [Cohnella sp. WQ 127256]
MEVSRIKPTRIRTKYMRALAGAITLVLLIGVSFYFYTNEQQRKLDSELSELKLKTDTILSLSDTLYDFVFRARGYYVFQSNTDLEQLKLDLKEFDVRLQEFSSLKLTSEDRTASEDLRAFYNDYTTNLLPKAIGYAEAKDFDALRELLESGANQIVYDFMDYTSNFKENSDNRLNQVIDDSIKQSNQFTIIAILFSMVILLLLGGLFWRLLRSLITPILELEAATKSLAAGQEVPITLTNRSDELGRLNDSFIEMTHSIQIKEEELMMQNEELQAQQEELQAQQAQLQHSLTEIESIMKALDQSSAVAILNEHGVFTYTNERLTAFTQFKSSALLGKPYKIIKIRDSSLKALKELEERVAKGGVWNIEMELERQDGSAIWFDLTVVPYLNEHGEVYKYILIGNDITSNKAIQKELAESLQQTEKTMDILKNHNLLNHEITYTLNKQDLVEKFNHFINELHSFDSSLFMIVRETIYSSRGIPQEVIERYVNHSSNDMLDRLAQEKTYIVQRKASNAELGISTLSVDCYDLYTAVTDTKDNVVALFCATRIGRVYEEEEIEAIQGLMKRVSLAVERIEMVEDIEMAHKLNQDIVNNVNEGIQFVDSNGTMTNNNQALSEIIMCKEWGEGKGIPIDQWIHDISDQCSSAPELEEFFRMALSQECEESSSTQYSIGNDTKRYIDVYATPVVRRGARIGTLFVHRNITKEHELDVMKSELVSTVSHELRTPLSSVLGFTELLLSKPLKPERQKKYLETIHKEALRLTNLINDFLDLQRMESGKQSYDIETFALNRIAMEVIDQYKVGTKRNVLLIDEAKFVDVDVDKMRIVQVFTNLISNGIKFSHEDGDVKVRMYNVQDKIVVRIEDKGLGIAKEQIDILFQKFRRVDNSTSRKVGGTGLGLAICKEIIEKHHGRIGIESVEGEGTSAWFELPLRSPKNAPEDDIGVLIDGDNENIQNVMIVEDDSSLSLLLSEELKAKGFRVTHHYNAQKAFEEALTVRFVGIVVDIMLGDELDGWDLIRMLKNDVRTEKVPIVISSALDKSDENLQEFSINKYLTKPYPPGELSKVFIEIINITEPSGDILFPDNIEDEG